MMEGQDERQPGVPGEFTITGNAYHDHDNRDKPVTVEISVAADALCPHELAGIFAAIGNSLREALNDSDLGRRLFAAGSLALTTAALAEAFDDKQIDLILEALKGRVGMYRKAMAGDFRDFSILADLVDGITKKQRH